MDFKLIRAEYDRETERAYVELRAPDDDGRGGDRRGHLFVEEHRGPVQTANRRRYNAEGPPFVAVGRGGHLILARPMAALDFWYEFGSTYSYPAVMRIERLADAAGVTVRWRPFLLGPIFKELGWNDSPFNIYAAKGRYMWRDLARICEAEGLKLKLPPARFPQNGLKAARLALVGERECWAPAFSRAVFVANYAEQKDISDDATLRTILGKLGVDVEAAFAAANALENKEALKIQTAEAGMRGIFGAPSFTIGDELFWGNDRLEAAFAWATRS
jgi:2-hydroxychromene-2-carboxylate isomerase